MSRMQESLRQATAELEALTEARAAESASLAREVQSAREAHTEAVKSFAAKVADLGKALESSES